MARLPFGGTNGDVVYSTFTLAGRDLLAQAGAVEVLLWTAATGSTRVTDLLNEAGNPITSVITDADGQIPTFQGPDGVTGLWASVGLTGTRKLLTARTGGGGPGGGSGSIGIDTDGVPYFV